MRLKAEIRRITAVLLCAVMFFSAFCVPSYAAKSGAGEEKNYTADCPYIKVLGLMSTDIYVDKDDPSSDTVWPPQVGLVVKDVLKLLPSLAALAVTKNYSRFGEKLYAAVYDIFAPLYMYGTGEVQDNSGSIFKYPAREEIKKDSYLIFEYDWRLDPVELAAQLNDFINYVLDCSGSDEVVLECHSYGGVVTYTYLNNYGTEKVRSVAFNAAAVYGTTFVGEICAGHIVLNDEGAVEYLKSVWAYSDAEKLLNGLIGTLYKTGVLGWLCDKVNDIAAGLGKDAMANCLLPMFGSWPSIWSMVSDECYDEAYNHIFNEICPEYKLDYSALQKKVDNYTDTIRVNRQSILENIKENCNLYVLARYGFCTVFIVEEWKTQSDMAVDLKYSSFGATAALYGETLGKSGKLISPKGDIDASTCLFPEQTWFLNNATHIPTFRCMHDWFARLLYFNGQATVETFEDSPQFLFYDENAGEFISDSK
ncbi:MAG: hypothetical protein IKH13_02750 [Clostridia bacterium]|nr:hypothetical protein [Clostridia bacterium]